MATRNSEVLTIAENAATKLIAAHINTLVILVAVEGLGLGLPLVDNAILEFGTQIYGAFQNLS